MGIPYACGKGRSVFRLAFKLLDQLQRKGEVNRPSKVDLFLLLLDLRIRKKLWPSTRRVPSTSTVVEKRVQV